MTEHNRERLRDGLLADGKLNSGTLFAYIRGLIPFAGRPPTAGGGL